MNENTVINGFFDKQIAYKPMAETLFTITGINDEQYLTQFNNVLCSGNVPILTKKHPIELTGQWEKRYDGYVFKVDSFDIKETTITGIYNKTLFRNEENGYTIFSMKVDKGTEHRSDYGTITCIGNMSVYGKDMPLSLTGYWEETKYGYSFKITKSKLTINSEEIAINYLSSNLCKGIGKKISEEIVKFVGTDIFHFALKPNAADILYKNIKHLNKEKAEQLIDHIKNTIAQKDVFEYIIKFGGSSPSSIRIANHYGPYALQKLKENPYEVGEVGTLSFYICDAIAKECNLSPYSEIRIQALINEALKQITQNGNTYTTQQEIYDTIKYITKNSYYNVEISKYIVMPYLTTSKYIVIETNQNDKSFRIFPRYLYNDEISIIDSIKRLDNKKPLNYSEDNIEQIEILYDINYAESQKNAFNLLKTSGIKILTGGPGTGKTTTINGILQVYKLMYPDNKVILCAPTGRAAQKIKESTNEEAQTIHKILNYQPYGNEVICKNESNPIQADFIIVDEFSMVDTNLMALLLKAIKNDTLLLFVGDIDQLPSVGAGNIMADLLKSNKIETYSLKTIFRQSETSNIVINANKINKGDTQLSIGDDFQILNFKNKNDLLNVLTNKLKEMKDMNIDELQILTPTRNSIIGTNELNILAQRIFNVEKLKVSIENQMMDFINKDGIEQIYFRLYKDKYEPPSFELFSQPVYLSPGNWLLEYYYCTNNDKSRNFKKHINIDNETNNNQLKKIRYGKFEFKKDDKIIMTRNNYDPSNEKCYYNGDIGVIMEVHEKYLEILINGEIKTVNRGNWNDIELAYAITIHKSQGSEYENVIVIIPEDLNIMLQRNLIFTAITRAKSNVIIFNEGNGLNFAIQNDKTNLRNTYLYERLIGTKTNILKTTSDQNMTL